MRFLLMVVALSCFSIGCQSPYRPSQIPPPGTGTVGRRDPYYQPNATQLGANERRGPAYTASRDRNLYNSDQEKIDNGDEQEFDDTLLDDTSSTSPAASTIVREQEWRSPELANNGVIDDGLYQASRYTPGYRR